MSSIVQAAGIAYHRQIVVRCVVHSSITNTPAAAATGTTRNCRSIGKRPLLFSFRRTMMSFSQSSTQPPMTTTMKYVFDPVPAVVPSLPVVVKEASNNGTITAATTATTDTTSSSNEFRFPIHRVYCVGKNYADHVQEMGGNVERSRPVFFTKPTDGVVVATAVGGRRDPQSSAETNDDDDDRIANVEYPPHTTNLHYEVELVVAIGREGPRHGIIAMEEAHWYIFGYGVGIDLTRRDLQSHAKTNGLPWDTAKHFDQSAPMGCLTQVVVMNKKDDASSSWSSSSSSSIQEQVQELEQNSMMQVTVNGQIRQRTRLSDMIWNVEEIISELSRYYRLRPGDLIMTGTPSGVGPLQIGDHVVGTVDGLEPVEFVIVEPPKGGSENSK